jgi:hypothetical protein
MPSCGWSSPHFQSGNQIRKFMPDSSHDLIYRILVQSEGVEKAAKLTAIIEEQAKAMEKGAVAANEWTAAQKAFLASKNPILAQVSPAALQRSDSALYAEALAVKPKAPYSPQDATEFAAMQKASAS